MQIYIASSWRNQHAVEMLTELLEGRGHNVLSFVRKAIEEGSAEARLAKENFDDWVWSTHGQKKFQWDIGGATTADVVVYIGPSGTDAWAEVGAAWAKNVKIIGLWAKGEPAGLMRRMMHVWCLNYRELLEAVDRIQAEATANQ